MRTYRQAALAATLGLAPIAADAAPASMLHSLPRAESSQAAGESSGGMRWLTKWFRDDQPQAPQVVAAPGGGVPAVMAYQPPQAPQAPARPVMPPGPSRAPSIEAWGGFSPHVAVPTTPIASVAPTAAAPVPTPQTSAPQPVDTKALRRRGHELDRAGKLAEAERTYRQAIGADPTSAAAVNDLGLCLARQGKLQPSAAVLRQAIMMRPDKPLYRNNIATVLVELDQADEALVHLKTAYGPATAHYNLGQLLTRGGKTDEAVAQFREAVNLEPTLAPAQEALARLTPEAVEAPTLADEGPQPTLAEPYASLAPSPAPGLPTAAPTPVAAAPYRTTPIAPATPAPATPYQPAQVASAAPTFVTPAPPVAPAPTLATPSTGVPSTGVPSFPRLLPPVMDR
ncbi:Tetratricopeptide repeat protein [Planctomycetes bacterium MalM25]|nr:Tetratricopeptide repeat protein [Planctomycetes bacterium MalM25]